MGKLIGFFIVLAWIGIVGLALTSAAFPQVVRMEVSQAELQGRLQAFENLYARSTQETVMLAGQIADLRAQLEQAKKQCAPQTENKEQK